MVALAAGLVVAGCGSAAVPDASSPPRLTSGSAPAALEGKVLRNADLRAVPAVPPALLVTRIDDQDLTLDPDPRGPCGAQATQPDFTTGANVGLSGGGVQGFESVLDLGADEAARYLAAMVADIRPGCPPWESTTAQGTTQTGELVRGVDLGMGADTAAAATVRVSAGGRSIHASQIVVRSGGTVAVVVVLAATPLDDEIVRGLASAAATRLG